MNGAASALLARLRAVQARLERVLLRTWLSLALRPTASRPEALLPARPTAVLALLPDEIGDMVLALPLLKALRLRHPRARLSLVAQGVPGGLALRLGLADEVIALEGGRALLPVLLPAWRAWRVARRLRGRRFDLVLFPRTGADHRQAGLLAALLAAPTAAFEPFSGEEEVWDCLPSRVRARWRRVASREAHEAARLGDFARALGLRLGAGPVRLSTPALRRRAAGRLKAAGPGPWLAVAPFARSRRRAWPLERWADLVPALAKQRRLRPFVLAGPGEAGEAAALAALLGPGTPVFAGLDLRESAALLSRASLFAGADSAAVHLAAAEGRPCLVLSCHPVGAPPRHANAPERFGPRGVEALVLRPARHAWPCRRGCDAFEPHCILGLEPASVRAAALAWRPKAARV